VPEAHEGKRVLFTSSVVNQVISSAPLTASAGNDGSVKLWDARQKAQKRATSVIRGHKGGVTAFATRDARGGAVGSILTGDVAGIVRAWDPRHATAGPVALAQAHAGKVTAIAPLQRSDMTASAGQDCVIRVLRFDGERGGDISLSGHLSNITSLAVLQDDTRAREPVGVLVSGSDDGHVRVWSGGEIVNDIREPWRCVSNTRAHIGAVNCLASDAGAVKRSSMLSFKSSESANDSAKILLSASVDHSFASWKLSTLNASWLPSAMSAPAKDYAFDATCSVIESKRRRLFTGDRFGTIRATLCPDTS
jgi:WD40 repeat protein